MEPNKFPSDLLQKYLDGVISETESTALFAWLRENPSENNEALEVVLQEAYDGSMKEKPALSADASQRILNRLMVSINETESVRTIPFLRRTWVRYAAAAVLLLAVAGTARLLMRERKQVIPPIAVAVTTGSNRAVLKLSNGQEIVLDSAHGSILQQQGITVHNDSGKLDYEGHADVVEYHTLSTPRGGQYKVQLPDGTAVWLNAASGITYPTAFTGKERKVKISGEAYFEVAANAKKPFRVDVDGKATVEVLGTRFNVNAYTDEQHIRTTLLDGRVKVVHGQQASVLKPGQEAQITAQGMDIIDSPDLEMAIAWKNGSFRFDHAHLKEVLRQMSRWYDVTVIYEPGSTDIIFSGEIKRDLNLPQALIVLETMGVHFRIEGKQLIVMP
ncbi:FecR family protein [Chitinophaga flava]|uniref:Iron dicitrate transport regulator FecR n=1 Tax=Chitinophaga flava TaxID=2259036 RepID=A0A365XVN3_9BACT|nr:FecR family protein [Chitinophaga flava]RBL90158.1 iron dicitrate transport regulator FecR [Chitinophaga flava]